MDKEQYGPWAFIAGGSEGVGASFARKLAAKGINVVLAARKPEPLEALAKEIRKDFKVEVRTLPLDLMSDKMLDEVKAVTHDIEVGMLIYNAGADSQNRKFMNRDPESADKLIMLNVTSPTRLIYHFGPGMRARKRGGIILVGSMAGHAGSTRFTTYAASKAYQMVLAEGLWYQLKPDNVHVLALVLSVTRTPAMERVGLNFNVPGFEAAEPDDVAQEGLDHLGKEPVWNAAGNEPRARELRTLARADAVAMISDSSASVSNAINGA